MARVVAHVNTRMYSDKGEEENENEPAAREPSSGSTKCLSKSSNTTGVGGLIIRFVSLCAPDTSERN